MNEIKFNAELVKRLVVATTATSVAVGEAALQAVAQDKKVSVRAFATALRECAPMLGTSTQVFSAAVTAAKEKGANLDKVCQAMAIAADKKRRDDARRAAEKRDAAPQKALEKALLEVQECQLALRSPLERAQDELAAADAAVKAAAAALKEARDARRKARAALALIGAEDTEQAA